MRLHFDFSEYEDDEDGGTRVLLTVNIPDGSGHSRVTEIYEKAVSLLYGYDITLSPQLSIEVDDGFKPIRSCPEFGCGEEFK